MTIDLGPGWPFARAGAASASRSRDDGLRVELTLDADEPMPVVVGWHPWFRRPVELEIAPARAYERGPDGLPTGRLVDPRPRPWDDCVIELAGPPRLTWPHGLSLEITSSADHWVVYDETDGGRVRRAPDRAAGCREHRRRDRRRAGRAARGLDGLALGVTLSASR